MILDEDTSKAVLASYGISRPAYMIIHSRDIERLWAQADLVCLKYPVVAKILGADMAHKTEIKGVIVGIDGPDRLLQAIDALSKRHPGKDILVEEFIPHSAEFILGLTRDTTFGQMVMFGAGGIAAELYSDVAFRKAPITEGEAKRMVASTQIGKLFNGYRGIDMDQVAVTSALVGICRLSKDGVNGKRVIGLDVNPVAYVNGKLIALDAKLMVEA